MTVWSNKELELGNTQDEVRSFFVRVKGSLDDLTKIKENFGNVKTVTVEDIEDEFGFVTQDMTEKEFTEAAKNIPMISRIRIDKTVFS